MGRYVSYFPTHRILILVYSLLVFPNLEDFDSCLFTTCQLPFPSKYGLQQLHMLRPLSSNTFKCSYKAPYNSEIPQDAIGPTRLCMVLLSSRFSTLGPFWDQSLPLTTKGVPAPTPFLMSKLPVLVFLSGRLLGPWRPGPPHIGRLQ